MSKITIQFKEGENIHKYGDVNGRIFKRTMQLMSKIERSMFIHTDFESCTGEAKEQLAIEDEINKIQGRIAELEMKLKEGLKQLEIDGAPANIDIAIKGFRSDLMSLMAEAMEWGYVTTE